jgi:predicted amidophosphoribosyltransferase
MECPNCLAELPRDADVCDNCGQEFCPQCHEPVPARATTCLNCGETWSLACPECGHDISAIDTKCPHCGLSFEEEFEPCPHCGRPMPDTADICPHCKGERCPTCGARCNQHAGLLAMRHNVCLALPGMPA